jgi:hypothetical protein
VEAGAAAASLVGATLADAAIARAAELAAEPARPMDNTDFPLTWRKRVVREFVSYALRDVRGDDVGELRRRRQASTVIVQVLPHAPGARS